MPDSIDTRSFGRTKLRVSSVGFGCGTTADLMVSGSLKERCDAVARAVEYGITLFDTAPVYGNGQSECNLGEALDALDAPVAVATKIVLEESDLHDIRGAILASVERSLKRLRRAHISILHLHNRIGRQRAPRPNIGVGALLSLEDVLGPVAETMQTIKRDGVTDAIGCCAFGGEMGCVGQVIESGAFDGVLANYSALNPSAFSDVPAGVKPDYAKTGLAAAQQGMGIVALRILEGGALVEGAAVEFRNPELLDRYRRNEALHQQLQRADISLKEAAIRFALFGAHVSTALVGISSIEQLDEIANFARRGPLPQTMIAALYDALFAAA